MSITKETENYINLAVGKAEGRIREMLREHQMAISESVSGIEKAILAQKLETNERIDEKIHSCQSEKRASSRWLIGIAVPLVSGIVAFLVTHYGDI